MKAVINVVDDKCLYKILDTPIIEYLINDINMSKINSIDINSNDNDIINRYRKDFNVLEEDKMVINSNLFILEEMLDDFINFHYQNNNDLTYIDKDFYIIRKNIAINDSNIKSMKYETDKIFYISSMKDITNLNKIIRKKVNNSLINKGVILLDEDNTYISLDSQIEEGTIIEPGNIIYHSVIGKDNQLLGYNRIINSKIMNDNLIISSNINNAKIGSFNEIGPYTRMRNNVVIGNHNRFGNFVEIKASNIGSYTKASHLTYIGDCECGSGVNFGCGCVTANYDGKNKYKTIIKDNVFIGCNSILIAPIVVGTNSLIAAGSTITENVLANSLAIARARQINKENYRQK